MSTRYGRTPGGYFWMVAEPMAAILFLSVGFSLVMRSPSLGTSFLLFYATGYLPFNLYSTVSSNAARALTYSKPLLRYPAVTWIDAVLARFVLNALTGILTATLLLSLVLAVVDSRAQIDMGPIVEATLLALVLGLGLGMMNCALNGCSRSGMSSGPSSAAPSFWPPPSSTFMRTCRRWRRRFCGTTR